MLNHIMGVHDGHVHDVIQGPLHLIPALKSALSLNTLIMIVIFYPIIRAVLIAIIDCCK